MSYLDYRLVDTDPVAIVLSWLSAHPAVVDVLGGPGRVSGELEGPWPHVRVAPAGGNVGNLLDAVTGQVSIEAYGDPAGSSPSQLRRIGMTCLLAVRELTERDHQPGQAVVSVAVPVSPLAPSPLTNRQGRWRATVSITAKPG
jgi:hypothetical protein